MPVRGRNGKEDKDLQKVKNPRLAVVFHPVSSRNPKIDLDNRFQRVYYYETFNKLW